MAWRCPGDKPLFESMMVSLSTHICVTRPQWVKIIACGLIIPKSLWLPEPMLTKRGSYCVCTQPMKADVTMWRRLSLAGRIHKMIPGSLIVSCTFKNKVQWNFIQNTCLCKALRGPEVRAPGPWKSNGVLVKFCLRAQWTPQNWRIGNVFQWFQWLQSLLGDLGNSNGGGPDPQQEMSTESPALKICETLGPFCAGFNVLIIWIRSFDVKSTL